MPWIREHIGKRVSRGGLLFVFLSKLFPTGSQISLPSANLFLEHIAKLSRLMPGALLKCGWNVWPNLVFFNTGGRANYVAFSSEADFTVSAVGTHEWILYSLCPCRICCGVMGHHHHITWLSHHCLWNSVFLSVQWEQQEKMTQKAVAKLLVFLGTCPSVLEVVECGHWSKPDLSSLPISCSSFLTISFNSFLNCKSEDNNFIR